MGEQEQIQTHIQEDVEEERRIEAARILLTRLDDRIRQTLDNQGRILARLDLLYEQMTALVAKPVPDTTAGLRPLIAAAMTVSLAAITGIIAVMVLLANHIIGGR